MKQQQRVVFLSNKQKNTSNRVFLSHDRMGAPVKSASTEADSKVRVQRRKLRAEITATSHVKGISNITASRGTLEACEFVKGMEGER